MRSYIPLLMLPLSIAATKAQMGTTEQGGVLSKLSVAWFAGSKTESIQAIASDAEGNLYVAGTTLSPDLPMEKGPQLAMATGALLRSTNQGLTWQSVQVPATLAVTVNESASNPQTLVLGATDGIYKTTDGGKTWRHVYAGATAPSDRCCFDIAIDPVRPNRVYAYVFGATSSFLGSSDGGESWQVRNPPGDALRPGGALSSAKVLWVDPNGSGVVALGMWLSRDQGTTWTRMAPLPMWTPTFTVPDPRHAGWIYAASSAGTSGRLYLSKDFGVTWAERPNPIRNGNPVAVGDLVFDPDAPNVIYAPDFLGFLNVSDDGGANWHAPGTPLHLGLDGVRPVVLNKECGGGAYFTSSGGLVTSFDSGATWEPARLSRLVDLAAGADCSLYVVRSLASDAFIAKFAPGGSEVLWSTYFGGSDQDASSAIALDTEGNVYVGGNTASADFPLTAPRTGQQGQQNVFVAKFSPGGKLMYSVVFGGEGQDGVTGLAVNAREEAHLVGWTSSKSFPATPGAFRTEQTTSGDGFAIKLAASGTAIYATYLPNLATYRFDTLTINPPRALAVVAEASGSALVGGYAGMLYRLSSDGFTLTTLPSQPGQIFAMQTDSQGDIYIAGQSKGADTQSGPCFQGYYYINSTLLPGDIFVTKLRADDLKQLFYLRLSGACQSWPGAALKIGLAGEITLGLWSFGSFPTRASLMPFSNCGLSGAAVVARLSADGSSLVYSTYLDSCGAAPAVALAPRGSIYAAVGRGGHAAVLLLPVPAVGGPTMTGAFNAFSGAPGFLSPGMLLTITGQDLAASFVDLGLNHAGPLPHELGGVQVLFDAESAEMLQVAPDHVICVVPAFISDKSSAAVQVVRDAQASLPFVIPA